MQALESLSYSRIPSSYDELRLEVRSFLQHALKDFPAVRRSDSWMGFDAQFSKKLGAKGWIGMALPKQYGGSDAPAFARYVVMEELLAAGAPVSAHWISDRQSAPQILQFGTQAQKEKHIPAICRGEQYFCIGMSEPSSGSDLASIKSRARKHGDKWILNGQKLWTTNAHRSHYMIALVRTSDSENRHGGMSQVLIDLSLPGVTVRPITDLTGAEHFNEVFFEDVELSEDALIGVEGDGWNQVTAELAFERSGAERFLSSVELLLRLVSVVGSSPDAYQAKEIGRLVARLITLRNMSLTVTQQLQDGKNPTWEASCLKDLGSVFEQEIPEIAHLLLEVAPTSLGGSDYAQVLAALSQQAPSFSLRGGTREILRGIIARGLGLR
ncbi:MAG: acyl-CoA dehydrogenase family protein [Arenicella sp.]|jgi:alkylation response protein AidB-like acyl-CoA dehydrogenase|nr:acyl-CoA dehydrogenase family protein [Arenicella sp.]